ncbi:MAG TPA: hypothetical protein VJZ68_03590 [Nitrososphaera sp.]|nr:hypothetical protein [Nitrososphaera sp.]
MPKSFKLWYENIANDIALMMEHYALAQPTDNKRLLGYPTTGASSEGFYDSKLGFF